MFKLKKKFNFFVAFFLLLSVGIVAPFYFLFFKKPANDTELDSNQPFVREDFSIFRDNSLKNYPRRKEAVKNIKSKLKYNQIDTAKSINQKQGGRTIDEIENAEQRNWEERFAEQASKGELPESFKSDLLSIFENNEIDSSKLASLECRSHTCRMEILHDSMPKQQKFLDVFLKEAPPHKEGWFRFIKDANPPYTLFFIDTQTTEDL